MLPTLSDKSEDNKNMVGYSGWLQEGSTGGSMGIQPGAHWW